MAVHLGNDCSIRVYQSFVLQFFKNISYDAGSMLNAFNDLLCSKLCWHMHNQLVPDKEYGVINYTVGDNHTLIRVISTP